MFYTKKINYQNLPPKSDKPSPTLIFHKWQAYDNFTDFKDKEAKLRYLHDIVKFVNSANKDEGGNTGYKRWFDNYIEIIRAGGAINTVSEFKTNWRLLVGWGTNPTLETGIQLHHFYGFPYIPGSAVKGLLHHVAELELCENDSWKYNNEENWDSVAQQKKEVFKKILFDAELIRILFGSIYIRKHEKDENFYGLETPLNWFEVWNKKIFNEMDENGEHSELIKRVKKLASNEQTGGMLTFFDAVPAQDTFDGEDMLQTDILNPHYQKYYQNEDGTVPPSDDQDPNPVYFLAVRPGVKFVFPYRIADFPVGEGRNEPEKERIKILQGFTMQQIKDKMNRWLHVALTEWGVGAKTASGYGYFKLQNNESEQ